MKRGLLFVSAVALLAAATLGCTSKHLVNFYDQHYYLSGKQGPSVAAIDKVIREAGVRRGWHMESVEPGHIVGLLRVRQHMAQIDIRFDRDTFSITYRDSQNLNYNASSNTIHRRYNTWVTYLRDDIQRNVPLAYTPSAGQPGSTGR